MLEPRENYLSEDKEHTISLAFQNWKFWEFIWDFKIAKGWQWMEKYLFLVLQMCSFQSWNPHILTLIKGVPSTAVCKLKYEPMREPQEETDRKPGGNYG